MKIEVTTKKERRFDPVEIKLLLESDSDVFELLNALKNVTLTGPKSPAPKKLFWALLEIQNRRRVA